MKPFKDTLLSTTVIPAVFGAGIMVGGAVLTSAPAHAATVGTAQSTPLPTAKPRPRLIQLAACKPCNPCAAKKSGCNPCNPCGASGGSTSLKCFVPSLKAKGGCNPCNPCVAKNPCAAKGCNPCNPCGASAGAKITNAEAKAVYNCLQPELKKAYSKAGLAQVKGYTGWVKINQVPYQSATHGARYVNNYADKRGAQHYMRFEKAGTFHVGSVLAKDSFVVKPNGKVSMGPLFVMEKMGKGFNKEFGDWRYTMILPNGKVAGTTKGKGMNMKFCAECHAGVAPDQDHVLLVPDEYRMKF